MKKFFLVILATSGLGIAMIANAGVTITPFHICRAIEDGHYTSKMGWNRARCCSSKWKSVITCEQPHSEVPKPTTTAATCGESETKTFNVNSSSGCKRGYCSCHKNSMRLSKRALGICEYKGYPELVSFKTRNGPMGQRQCHSADGRSGCFINKYAGNLICTTVTCKTATKTPKTTQEPNCATNVFHPHTKRCLAQEVIDHPNGYVFTEAGVCIPTLQGVKQHCTDMPAWDGCKQSDLKAIVYNFPENSIKLEKNIGSGGVAIVPIEFEKTNCYTLEKADSEACKEYISCYNTAVNRSKDEIEKTKSEVASATRITEIENGLAAARECFANYEKALNGQDVESVASGPQAGEAPTTNVTGEQAQSIGFNTDQTGIIRGDNRNAQSQANQNNKDSNVVRFFNSGTASDGSASAEARSGVIAGTAASRSSGGGGFSYASGRGASNRASRSDATGSSSALRFRRSGAAQGAGNIKVFPNKGYANQASARNLTSAADGMESGASAKNQTTLNKRALHYGADRTIFQMVTAQYHGRADTLRSIDEYIRKIKPSRDERLYKKVE